jgi:hypothetical protein
VGTMSRTVAVGTIGSCTTNRGLFECISCYLSIKTKHNKHCILKQIGEYANRDASHRSIKY